MINMNYTEWIQFYYVTGMCLMFQCIQPCWIVNGSIWFMMMRNVLHSYHELSYQEHYELERLMIEFKSIPNDK